MTGSIAEFFAKVGVDVDESSLKKVDELFSSLNKKFSSLNSSVIKEAQQSAKASQDRIKAVQAEVKANKELAKSIKVVGKNQAAWNKQFKTSLSGMVRPGLSSRAYKQQQEEYNKLFGATSPVRILGGNDLKAQQKAFSERINGRLSYLSGEQSPLGKEMSAFYRSEEKAAERASKKRVEEENLANKQIEKARQQHQQRLERRIRISEARMRARQRAWLDSMPSEESSPSSRPRRSASSISRSNYLSAGGGLAAFARYGMASLPFVGGVYGLSQLNQANQEMISNQIAAESVFGKNSPQVMKWFQQQADYVGFNYNQTMPTFTKFMASAMPLMGTAQSQDVFASFLKFGRTRGATDVGMNRAMNAVSQMAA